MKFYYNILLLFAWFLYTQEEDFVFEDLDQPITVVEFKPPVPPAELNKGITLNIPLLGDVTFKPATPPQTGLIAQVPQMNKPLQVGPLIISSGNFTLDNGKLGYVAHGTLFGKAITVGLKEFGKGKIEGDEVAVLTAQFGIEFKEHPTLEIIPGKTATIRSADIIVQRGKPTVIRLGFTLLNQPVTAQVKVTKDVATLNFEIKEALLSALIPPLDSTSLKNVMLKNVEGNFNLVTSSKNEQSSTVHIIAHADFSQANLGNQASLKDVELSIELSKQSIHAQAQLRELSLPSVGTVKNAQFTIDKTATQPLSITIVASSALTIPHLGPMQVDITAGITAQGINLNGTVEQTIKFSGIAINKGILELDSATGILYLEGLADIVGLHARLKLSIKGTQEISAEGELLSHDPIKPFAMTKIPQISNISFNNPQLQLAVKDEQLNVELMGQINIFDTPLTGVLHVSSALDSFLDVYMEIKAPPSWTLAKLIPPLKDTPLNNITIKDLRLVISSTDREDEASGFTFKKGINLYGYALEEGALEPLAQLTGEKNKEAGILLFGALAANISDSVLQAKVPVNITLKTNAIVLKNLGVDITVSPPRLALDGTMAVQLPHAKQMTNFTVEVGVGPEDAEIQGSMVGEWKEPFGIKNFSLRDMAAEIVINYKLLVTTGLPDTIGFTGSFAIGDRTARVAGKTSFTKSEEMVLVGELNKLELADFVALGAKIVKQSISINKVPKISIDDLKFYLVPKATTIGVFNFDQGLSLEGTLHIPNFTARGRLTIQETGIKGEAYASKVQCGPLLITGAGPDRIYGTPDDGPIIDFALTPREQRIYASVLVQLDPLFKGNTELNFEPDKMSFLLLTKIKNVFDATIKAEAALIDNPDFKLFIEFKSDFFNFIQNKVNQSLTDFQHEADAKLSEAQRNLRPLQSKWDDITYEIGWRNKQINKDKKKIDDDGWRAFLDVKEMARITQLGIEIGGLEVSRNSIKAAYESSKGILEGLKKSSYYVIGEGGKLVTKSFLNAIQINYVKFEGSARDIASGVMPKLSLTITVFGKQRVLTDVQFDFNHPDTSAQAIAKSLVKFVE